ncbi:MAG: M28 family peptidase [Anaerolineae bacterium]
MSPNNPFLTVDQKIAGDIYTATEAMDNLTTLCDEFGSRFGGTEGERRAADFLKAKLEAYGLSNVHREPVEYLGWRRGRAALTITAPIQKTIPCISLPQSPPAQLEGTIVNTGDGAPADFDRRAGEIKGNIVMTSSVVSPKGSKRWIHRSEKYGRSLLAGATGFIFVNHYPAYGPATGGVGHLGDEGLIPGISISKEDGAFIQRLIKRKGPVSIRLTTTDRSEPMTSWNIIGELPGAKQPEQIVMLGCHYDGHDISQGAEDPASGAVALLEAARTLAAHASPLPCTVRFALWGIEEIGLLGSKAYAKAHAAELEKIRFYLNMDAAGAVVNKGINLNEWPDLEPVLVRWGEEMALEFEVGQSVHAHSDHYPFFMAGVPTGGIEAVQRSLAGRGYGHTQFDTLDKVKLDSLREASALAARLALRLAAEEPWPFARRGEQAVQDILDSPEHREEVAYKARLAEFYKTARRK